jgi:hypothetical protein
MKLSLTDGLNGLALKFKTELDNGYSFIDITDSLVIDNINYISFYASNELITYIGYEINYLNINFNRALNIKLDDEIEFNNSDIRYVQLTPAKNCRYYLIVQGDGVIDDIIISTEENSIYESHTKNISLLGFNLYEKKAEGSRYKISLKTNKDYTPYQAGLMSDGCIKNTSSIDWHITKIKEYTSDDNFKKCSLSNIGVNNDYVYTTNKDGFIETPPIYIGDVDNIKCLIFKINNISFNNMTGFITSISICDTYNGEFIPIGDYTANKFNIKQKFLNKYIKLNIKMPPYKVIDNITIFAEYIATNDNPLSIQTKQSGHIISKVYDLQETCNCIVKTIDIKDISNINDIEIYIRSSKDEERLDVWNEWKRIIINDKLKISKTLNLYNARFLQFKIVIKNRNAYIKFDGMEVEIK